MKYNYIYTGIFDKNKRELKVGDIVQTNSGKVVIEPFGSHIPGSFSYRPLGSTNPNSSYTLADLLKHTCIEIIHTVQPVTCNKRIAIIATEFGVKNHGLENRTSIFEFLVENHMSKDDILHAIQSASTDFCKTETGKRTYIDNCNNFNIGDFNDNIETTEMKDICKTYGIQPVSQPTDTISIDFNLQLVDEYSIFPEDEE